MQNISRRKLIQLGGGAAALAGALAMASSAGAAVERPGLDDGLAVFMVDGCVVTIDTTDYDVEDGQKYMTIHFLTLNPVVRRLFHSDGAGLADGRRFPIYWGGNEYMSKYISEIVIGKVIGNFKGEIL